MQSRRLNRANSVTIGDGALRRALMEEIDGTSENHGPQKWAVPCGGARGHDRNGGRRRQSVRLDRQDSVFAVPLWRIGEQTVLRRDPFQDWLPGRGGRREEDRGGRVQSVPRRIETIANHRLAQVLDAAVSSQAKYRCSVFLQCRSLETHLK